VRSRGEWLEFQRFMIVERAAAPIEAVELRGAGSAAPTPEAIAAIAAADAIVIGPSNPVVSIGPILAVPGIRQAIRTSAAPVVAVSPLVGGQVLKGPTDAFLQWAGQPLTSAGIAAVYHGLIDGLVADDGDLAMPVLEIGVMMDSAETRRGLAERTLEFALGLT
jgi:LPPG:FO 2-phospho-L-lactate transferase